MNLNLQNKTAREKSRGPFVMFGTLRRGRFGIGLFAVQREVEAARFLLFVDPQAHDGLEDFADDEAHHE